KCHQETDDPKQAAAIYEKLSKKTVPEADAAKRWAGLFRMQNILKDPTLKLDKKKGLDTVQRLDLIEALGVKWLTKDFPGYRDTPEGQGVRFELAETYLRQAKIAQDSKNPADKARAAGLFAKAQEYYAPLADSDSDYAEAANRQSLSISFMRLGDI